MRSLLTLFLLSSVAISAQQLKSANDPLPAPTAAPAEKAKLVVPSGTQVPLKLKQGISTKSAKVGDAVYAETNFPIVLNDRVAIPAGTYVQGRIVEVKRPGRVKGRAEVLMHFTSLVFPNGYTAMLPGAVENLPGAENQHIKGDEGTNQQNGSKSKDAGTIASTAGTGAAIGGIAGQGLKGAAIGGGMGAAVGTAIALLTRGNDVLLPEGTSVQMVLQRDLALDPSRITGNPTVVVTGR